MVFGAIVSFAVGIYAGIHIAEKFEIPTRRERKEMFNEMKCMWTEQMPSKGERKEIYDDIRALWMERMEERMAKRLEAQLEAENRGAAITAGDVVTKNDSVGTVPSEPKTYRQILEKYRKKRIAEMQ